MKHDHQTQKTWVDIVSNPRLLDLAWLLDPRWLGLTKTPDKNYFFFSKAKSVILLYMKIEKT